MGKVCFGRIVVIEQQYEYKIQTSFELNGFGPGSFNCFEGVLHGLDIYPEVYLDKYILIPKNWQIDINELKNKLKRWNFDVIDGQAVLEVRQTIPEKKVETKKVIGVKKHNELPSIIALDLKNYIKEGALFKGKEQIIEGAKWYEITVSITLNKLMAYYINFRLENSTIVPIKEFLSEYEKINKLLPKLPEMFKGKSILDFLSTRRNSYVVNSYKELTKIDKDESIGKVLSNGFTFIDANRIYDLIYKFGTHNRKAYYIYKNWYIMKPYKWDYVVIIDISYLNSLRDNEMITFSLL